VIEISLELGDLGQDEARRSDRRDRPARPDLFRCEVFHCRLTPAVCLGRQEAFRTGRLHLERLPVYPVCGDGRCPQGKTVRAAMPGGWRPDPYRALRGDLAEQFKARMLWRRTHVEPLTIDSFPEREDAGADDTSSPEAMVLHDVAQSEEGTMERKGRHECSGCGKRLRSSSKGELCYRCRVKDGQVVPERPAASGRPTWSEPLPDPSTLPIDYLRRCVAYANQRERGREDVLSDAQAV
jgi:hypothetical protein